jgi:hypothetical protein
LPSEVPSISTEINDLLLAVSFSTSSQNSALKLSIFSLINLPASVLFQGVPLPSINQLALIP